MHLSGLCDYCSVSQLDNLTTEDARTARQITHSTRLEDILKRRIGNWEFTWHTRRWISTRMTRTGRHMTPALNSRNSWKWPSEISSIHQYGFVRMHPSAAAKLFATLRGHLIVTTRCTKISEDGKRKKSFYRFSYDMGNKLYAAYAHAVFSKEFIRDVFQQRQPKGREVRRCNWVDP